VTTIQDTRTPSRSSHGALMWLLYLCAALLVASGQGTAAGGSVAFDGGFL
jgi:hypothetical protein